MLKLRVGHGNIKLIENHNHLRGLICHRKHCLIFSKMKI